MNGVKSTTHTAAAVLVLRARPGAACIKCLARYVTQPSRSPKNIAEPVWVYSLEVGKAAQAKPTKPPASRSVQFPCCWVRGLSHSPRLRASQMISILGRHA